MVRPHNSFPFVGSNYLGHAAGRGHVIEDPRDVLPADGPLRYNGNRLMRGIVHDRQTCDGAAFRAAVKHEIHRPDFIRGRRSHEGLPLAHRHLLAVAAPHLQLGFGVEPFNPLVLHHLTLLPHLQVNHAGPVPPVAMGEGDNGLPELTVPIRRGAVAQPARTPADHLQGLALREAPATHPAHHLPTSWCASLPLFSEHLAGDGLLQHRLRQEPLQPGILLFQRLQSLEVRHVQPAKLAPPEIVARFGEPMPSTQVLDHHPRLRFPHTPDNLCR